MPPLECLSIPPTLLAIFVAAVTVNEASAQTIDMRPYWPTQYQVLTYRHEDGRLSNRRIIKSNDPMNYWLPPAKTGEVRYAYEDWYPKPGTSIAGQPDPPLYLIGSWGMVNRADWSISEESDTWAYQQWTCTTWCGGPGQYYSYPGISYSPYGGIAIGAPYYTVKPITIYASKNYETTAPTLLSGTTTYSMVRAADLYDTFTPKFERCDDGTWAAGCGKTYRNVINFLLVHGVTGLNVCANMPSSLGHVPGYTSYWIQFFVAPGKNYVARRVLFDERSCHGWLIDGKAHYQEESIDE